MDVRREPVAEATIAATVGRRDVQLKVERTDGLRAMLVGVGSVVGMWLGWKGEVGGMRRGHT